jgi:hypothetical protein
VQQQSSRKQWIYPIATLFGLAVILFGALYAIDNLIAGKQGFNYFNYTHDHITDAVGGMSGLFAAILGIIITVVSIIVQLTADRYTQVTQMFFRDRTNLGVLGFYVLTCICGVFNAFSVHTNWVPHVTLTTMICLAAISFALMAPYFYYVFDFLQPEHIIARIRRDAIKDALAGAEADTDKELAGLQFKTLHGMEQLTDITVNSISGKDKIIAVAGVDGLRDLAVGYLKDKKRAKDAWFTVGPGIRQNPDFVSMAQTSVDDMERRHTWVEWKVLRQYQGIYSEALANMRDVSYVIAINTRYIGEAAVRADDREALSVCVKFMNSYLRATLNAREVRTAYNVLNQYRELVATMLRTGWAEKAVEVAGYLKYYAHVSVGMQLGFVCETIAYDLSSLCETAHDVKTEAESKLLNIFLQVDQPVTEGEAQETGLRGVRKAQLKLATYYLVNDAEPLARRIFEDMRNERPERLRSIKDELLNIKSEDFWEVIDRGTNFDYLSDERKAALKTFYSWFPRLSDEHAAQTTQKEAEA